MLYAIVGCVLMTMECSQKYVPQHYFAFTLGFEVPKYKIVIMCQPTIPRRKSYRLRKQIYLHSRGHLAGATLIKHCEVMRIMCTIWLYIEKFWYEWQNLHSSCNLQSKTTYFQVWKLEFKILCAVILIIEWKENQIACLWNKACRKIKKSVPCHCFGGETLLSTVWTPQNWRKLFQEGMAETEDSLCLQMTLSVKPLKENQTWMWV